MQTSACWPGATDVGNAPRERTRKSRRGWNEPRIPVTGEEPWFRMTRQAEAVAPFRNFTGEDGESESSRSGRGPPASRNVAKNHGRWLNTKPVDRVPMSLAPAPKPLTSDSYGTARN